MTADSTERFRRLMAWLEAEREKSLEYARKTQNASQSEFDRGCAFAFARTWEMASTLMNPDRDAIASPSRTASQGGTEG